MSMKTRSIIFIICLLTMACENDDYPHAEVPSVVLNEFWTEFPNATDVDFKPEEPNIKVRFKHDGRKLSALINRSGQILKQKEQISWEGLPVQIQEFLTREFRKENIEDPELVISGDTVYYQVQVRRFLGDENLVVDRQGRLDSTRTFFQ